MKYDHKKVEGKWQKIWQKEGIYEPSFAPASAKAAAGKKASKGKPDIKGKSANRRKPFYNLMMFPYPSAEGLHVGNAYAFIGTDIHGRFKRMQGDDVFEPIGLDGFGIHSENYALKIGAHPMKQAKVSEKRFYKQLASLGNGFSWNENLETYDPAYYKWTQWIFTQLFKKGLAYRKKQSVNWCPSCKTVLADEQVIAGKCERCSTVVIKKELEQWFFKITDYAERLLNNIEGLDWSEKVKIAQRNWIGKSEGAEIDFEVKTKEKPNFLILHGYTGSPRENKYPWIRKELEKRGYKVSIPELPNTNNPNEKEQVDYVLKNCKLDKNTVLFGHSLGAVVALKVLQKANKPIAKLVLGAAAIDPKFSKERRPYWDNFNWDFNFKKINSLVSDKVVISDINEPHRAAYMRYLTEKLSAKLIEEKSVKKHFTGPTEPAILDNLTTSIKVFTTRPDTLFGATYMVLAPENELIPNLKSQISNLKEVETYIKKAARKSEEERLADDNDPSTGSGRGKTGVELKGIEAINPVNGKEIPVWAADYVLTGYGTGAIMAVPAHDERDFEFAKKYKLPVIQVVAPYFTDKDGKDAVRNDKKTIKRKTAYAFLWDRKNNRYLCLDWEKFGWHSGIIGGVEDGEDYVKAGKREIVEETGYKNIKFVKYIGGEAHSHFFAHHKDVNRYAVGQGMLFELIDGKKNDDSEIDLKNHKPVWIEAARMKDWLNLANFKYMWQILEDGKECFADYGVAMNSGKFDGLDSETARWKITEFAGGKRKTQFRLRDWLISRQRYWSAPIPMIFCEKCATAGKGERKEMPGWYSVPENKLPVKLPFIKDFRPKGKGKSPLATVKSFYETKCPNCGATARRETDVSDTFLDSSWYFLRYPSIHSAHSGQVPWDSAITKRWLPVDMYIGGAEHSVLHLLYSRFLTMFFKDCGLIDFEEPFSKFRAHGLLIKEGMKMSKSKGNVVNPDEYIKNFGADTLRMYLMFLAPYEYGGDFRDAGIIGVKRFLERVWKMGTADSFAKTATENKKIKQALHATIKKVTEDIAELRYNTAISAMMILLNEFEADCKNVTKNDFENLLKLVAPFAPHMSEELWQILTNGKSQIANRKFKSIHLEKWPEYDKNLIKSETFTLVIQVNGKVRDSMEVLAGISREEAEKLALNREKIKNIIESASAKKVIYVPGRLVNIVV
ncbi:MAG TPA: alpha/beta fold hydrolase [Candidatus Paceibacterota bacterium]|nr:alpha/beta fold hydrolase [Candidatus Paceibacterota bacterium]